MMAYENALRLLAHLETPRPPDMLSAEYEAGVEDLVRSKFTYVVASQVYGNNRASNAAKGRWLARGVDILLHQYPGLRVAFIDTKLTDQGSMQFTVLIAGRPKANVSDKNCTEEVYRCKTGGGLCVAAQLFNNAVGERWPAPLCHTEQWHDLSLPGCAFRSTARPRTA